MAVNGIRIDGKIAGPAIKIENYIRTGDEYMYVKCESNVYYEYLCVSSKKWCAAQCG